MTLEWIDPPRNWQDNVDDMIRELRARPGQWARIARDSSGPTGEYFDYLSSADIEWRTAVGEKYGTGIGRKIDVYARAPKETR